MKLGANVRASLPAEHPGERLLARCERAGAISVGAVAGEDRHIVVLCPGEKDGHLGVVIGEFGTEKEARAFARRIAVLLRSRLPGLFAEFCVT